MDQRFRFLCRNQTDSRKLMLALGIGFGLFMVLQFFELPYDTMLSSLLSASNLSSADKNRQISPANSQKNEFSSFPEHNLSSNSAPEAFSMEEKNVFSSFSDDQQNLSSDSAPESILMKPKNDDFSSFSEQNLSSNSASESVLSSYNASSTFKNSNLNSIFPTVSLNQNDSSAPQNAHNVNERMRQSNLSASSVHNQSGNSKVFPVSEMNKLLQRSYDFPQSSIPRWHSKVDDELIRAKIDIMNTLFLQRDGELYGVVYRNVSMFKRSYELMEEKLKVYIYKDGEKPIFHSSILEGIYSAEGWFLKLLEANKHFVTKVPSEAHLFYLPFSSRLLELTLYVRHSHSRKNLIEFMKNYVASLMEKYPFWNRTNGEDHFLAACHDWAPAETRGKMLNCIRGLCNADIRTGFVIGKDVSVPTTYVRSEKNPLNDIGGKPSSERTTLAFFAGYMHGRVRPLLLKHWGQDRDMKIVDRLPHVKGNKNYIEHMKSSKYCICARGFAVHSPRVVESIFYECVPVIISDNYVPPFFEVLNWESFAVFILEKDISDMKRILLSISKEKYLEMQRGVKEVQRHFLWHSEPKKYDLFHMILHSVWYNRVFRAKLP